VWFGTRRETKEELRPRFTALFKIVESKDADVVCFQEMTTNIIALLMEQEWIRQRYWITDTDEARTFLGYGVLMLSKLPYKHLKLQELPTQLGRKVLVAEFNLNGQSFAIATSHLESYTKDAPIRAKQLRVIRHILHEQNYTNAVIMGDFNFASAAERLGSLGSTMKDYRDQWLELKGPAVAGYTYDAHKNLMLKKIKRAKKERVRIDLILSRSKNWRPAEVLLLGTRPIEHVYNGSEAVYDERDDSSSSDDSDSGTDTDSDSDDSDDEGKVVYPSDHFGLYGVLELVE
jgi:endonuclease/exonuclease/phosphatase family metal-dependent hydrolase